MFRGKGSSKQNQIISISSRLIEFWCFGLPAALGVGWVGVWGWGVVGGCLHTHAHTHGRGKHDNFMQMAASIGFLGNPWEFPMMSYTCLCVCACVCTCVGGTFLPPPTPSTHPSPPRGEPSESVKIQ